MIEMKASQEAKFTPLTHWLEDEDEADEEETKAEGASSIEAELRDRVTILRNLCAEMKSARVTWNEKIEKLCAVVAEPQEPLIRKLPDSIITPPSRPKRISEENGLSPVAYSLKFEGRKASLNQAPRTETLQVVYKIGANTPDDYWAVNVNWGEGSEFWRVKIGKEWEALHELLRCKGIGTETGWFRDPECEITRKLQSKEIPLEGGEFRDGDCEITRQTIWDKNKKLQLVSSGVRSWGGNSTRKTLKKVRCVNPDSAAQVRDWIEAQTGRITRNGKTWDDETIEEGNEFESIPRLNGGAARKGIRDLFSKANSRRRARRVRLAQQAKEERRRAREEAAENEERMLRSTAVIFEEEEFITTSFVDRVWEKTMQKMFFKLTRSFFGLEREEQRIVDQTTGETPSDIQGRTLILLAPDEVWENGCVALKKKKVMKFPLKGRRSSPICVKTGERNACIWRERIEFLTIKH
jgi:hypothetical protein